MNAVLTLPPPGSTRAARPFRFTVAEYRQLGTLGWFAGVKTMLLDGVVYAMPMPAAPHDTAVSLAFAYLQTAFPVGHYVRNQMGLDVGTRNDPGPDLAVVVGSIRDYAARTPTTAAMAVEVADSSLDIDTTTKAELYATAGVPEYWVLDIENRILVVFRDPAPLAAGLGATAYRTRLTFTPADRVSPLAAPAAILAVSDLLP